MSHPTDATNPDLETASTKEEYEVTREDLPLSCPMPDQKLWNSHPRVYLPIGKSGKERCPYCGAIYRLID
ncbi:MAG TPA: zinc-finger domain-containing protein [Xanthomonadales bacterium]|nr:zinc-finger domain-containing protein [Xanthomonadales bacterium]